MLNSQQNVLIPCHAQAMILDTETNYSKLKILVHYE